MKNEKQKFHLRCKNTGYVFNNFHEWFEANQKCPDGSARVEIVYLNDRKKILELIDKKARPQSLWHYFDLLPLNDEKNIVSFGEGIVPMERWEFLERYALEKHGIHCSVQVMRNDKNNPTGTFKDKGATLAASVLKENNIKQYIVVSTGNTATAFAYYLAAAQISLSVFIPSDALKQMESEISMYGQKVFRVGGDYAVAKRVAKDYADKYGILMTGGNFDPLRMEAKKIMVFEWLRELEVMPTVYIQALSGGTGPFAIEKAYQDIEGLGLADKMPRFILVQPSGCAPMAAAWAQAKANEFPLGFENQYPVYDNPVTIVPTLATGDPKTYPAMSRLVQKTEGEIIQFDESKLFDIARWVGYETLVRIGPASAVAIGGFINALKQQLIKQGDSVMLNIGEGVSRAADFMEQAIYTTKNVSTINDCEPFERESLRTQLWDAVG